MCVKKLIFSEFAGLQNYSWQLYDQRNSFTGIYQQHFKSPHAPPCIDSRPVLMFSKPVGNPAQLN